MSQRISEIPDWNLLYQQEQKKKNWQAKGPAHWDGKASSFAERTAKSGYAEEFLRRLPLDPSCTVLDMGSGPGTLSLPLAARCRHVTALDFSRTMLDILEQRAVKQGLHNISTRQLSWQDEWLAQGIIPHDIAIASRSLAVPDLGAALKKLNRSAHRLVCVADRVGSGPFDPAAFAAVGRTLDSGPDYIYTVNLLHQTGYLPKIDYIRLDEKPEYPSFAEVLSSCMWMFSDLNKDEEQKLAQYLRSVTRIREDGSVTVHSCHVPIWALISWRPDGSC